MVVLRITKFEIEKLFGHLNYSIPINQEKGVCVIYGLNSSGKTTILNIINLISNQYYNQIVEYDFKKITVFFEDSTAFSLEVSLGSSSLMSIDISEKFLIF